MATRGVNKVILMGRLGGDPDVRYTPSGKAVCNITVATSEVYKDQHGQKQEITDWHRIVIWGKQAEIVGQLLGKGDQIYIEGKQRTREWDDNGIKKYITEVIVDQSGSMQMIGNKERPSQGI